MDLQVAAGERTPSTHVSAMVSRLRSVGEWINVDVEFPNDWCARWINHNRIVAKAPFGGMGEPVVRHLVEHAFIA